MKDVFRNRISQSLNANQPAMTCTLQPMSLKEMSMLQISWLLSLVHIYNIHVNTAAAAGAANNNNRSIAMDDKYTRDRRGD